jgi:hypothetical protein
MKGQTAQGTVTLEAFLSLFTSFAPQVEGDEDLGADTNGAGANRKDDRKDSAPSVFAPLQVPQQGVNLPLNLAFLVATTTGGPSPTSSPAQDPNAIAPEPPGNADVARMTTSPFPPLLETGNSGGSTTTMAAQQSISIAPTISLSRWQTGNAPMAFAVLLKEASGQSSNVPELSTDGGVAIRSPGTMDGGSSSHGTLSPPIPGSQVTNTPAAQDAVQAAPQAPALPTPDPAQNQPVASEAAHTELEIAVNPTAAPPSPAPAASSAAAARTSVPTMPATTAASSKPKDIPPSQERGVERPANTPELTKTPGLSAAASSTDDVSAKHEEPIHAPLPSQTAPVTARAESKASDTTDARIVKGPDTETIGTPRPEIIETKPALPPQPTREISMRLTQADSPAVDIRVIDRAGTVRVAVRTADADLAQNLQSGLGELVHRLEHRGFEAEVWTPHSLGVASSQSVRSGNQDTTSQNGGRNPRDASQQGNGGQQSNGRSRPKWVAELEKKLARRDVE